MSLIGINPSLKRKYFQFEQTGKHVWLSQKVVVQNDQFYILDSSLYEEVKGMRLLELLKRLLGDTVEIRHEKSGAWSGYGHGRETVTVSNLDGSLVYELSHIGYCAGPGYSCSYNHGPWCKHGIYKNLGTISPEASLRQVVSMFLAGSATTDDLQNVLEKS